jgi:peroxiredoxin
MSRSTLRPLALVVAVVAAAGCGDGSPAKPSYNYSYGSYDIDWKTAFNDEAQANKKVAPGELPFAFVDHLGKPVDLAQYKGKSNVVLVVLRGLPQLQGGQFCPHCLAQTRGLMANEAEFKKRNAVVLVVFPGPAERVGEFIEQAKAKAESAAAGPPVLLDKDLAVVNKLGIQGGDLAKPSTYILDKQGAVVYGYVGETSTDRPSVKAVFAQLDKLQAGR